MSAIIAPQAKENVAVGTLGKLGYDMVMPIVRIAPPAALGRRSNGAMAKRADGFGCKSLVCNRLDTIVPGSTGATGYLHGRD